VVISAAALPDDIEALKRLVLAREVELAEVTISPRRALTSFDRNLANPAARL
jgi:hypothetical protein